MLNVKLLILINITRKQKPFTLLDLKWFSLLNIGKYIEWVRVMTKDHFVRLSYEVTRKKRCDPSLGTTNEIYCESVLMFLIILNTNTNGTAQDSFVRHKVSIREEVEWAETFYLFLSFAHVKNNKALLKIAFNRKKSVWFTIHRAPVLYYCYRYCHWKHNVGSGKNRRIESDKPAGWEN